MRCARYAMECLCVFPRLLETSPGHLKYTVLSDFRLCVRKRFACIHVFRRFFVFVFFFVHKGFACAHGLGHYLVILYSMKLPCIIHVYSHLEMEIQGC